MKLRHALVATLAAVAVVACGSDIFLRQTSLSFATASRDAATAAEAFYTSLIKADRDFFNVVFATDSNCAMLPDDPEGVWPGLVMVGKKQVAEAHGARMSTFSACARYSAALQELGERVKREHAAQKGDAGASRPALTDAEELYYTDRVALCLTPDQIACARADETVYEDTTLKSDRWPLRRDAFQSEFELLQGVNSYLEALAKLAADPKVTIRADLDAAVADVEGVQKLLGQTWIDDDLKKRLGAIGDLASTLKELQVEAEKAREIRRLVLDRAPDISRAIVTLADQIDADFATLLDPIVEARRTRLYRSLTVGHRDVGGDRWHTLDEYARAVELSNTYAKLQADSDKCSEGQDDCARGTAPAARLLRAAATAQSDLARIAAGNLTKDERRKALAISLRNYQRVASGLVGVLRIFSII